MPNTTLYDLADQLHQLAPWNWMQEAQLIYLRHPETGESAYISIMGRDGAHLCLALYIGAEALHRFNLIHDAEFEEIQLSEDDALALILESRQLQISFNSRAELQAGDLTEIKNLKRKYRGNNWPTFRSFHPGCAPGPLSESDAVWMSHAIAQLMHVAPILKDDPFGDYRGGAAGTEILSREKIGGVWQTTWTLADKSLHEFPSPAPQPFLATKVAGHPSAPHLECHFQLLPNPVMGNDHTGYFPYVALSVDSRSGLVLGLEMLSVETQSHAAMMASIPDLFLRQWDKNNIRPASICVSSQTTRSLLLKTAAALNIPLHLRRQLPALEKALASAMGFLSGHR